MVEEKTVATDEVTNTINEKPEVEEPEDKKVAEQEENEQQSTDQKTPKILQVPTLYVRNLNDKVKLEGKCSTRTSSASPELTKVSVFQK